MKIIYFILGILLLPISLLASLICALFFLLSLFLAPVPILGNMASGAANLFFALAIYLSVFWFSARENKVRLTEKHIEIQESKNNIRYIKWNEIKEIDYEFEAPFFYPMAIISNCEKYRLDSVDHEELANYANEYGITINRMGKS